MAAHHRSLFTKFCLTLGWLSVLVALLVIAVSIATGKILPKDIYNADTFQIPTLWRDLWQHGSFTGWDLPVNPPLFPDGLLLGLVWLLIPNLYVTYVVYGAVQILLFLVGLLLLLRQLVGRPLVDTWLLLVATLFLWLLATGQHNSLLFILLPGHHFGVLLVLPAVLLWVIKPLLATTANPRYELGLGLVAFLTAFSDSLFVVQLTLPLLITLGILAMGRAAWQLVALRLAGTLLSASAAGQLVRLQIVGQEKLSSYIAPVTRAEAREALAQWLTSIIQHEPLLAGFWLVAVGALLIVAVLLWRDGRRSEVPLPTNSPSTLAKEAVRLHVGLVFVITYLLLTASLSVVATLVAGNFFSATHTRYLLPTIYLPLWLGLPLLAAYCAAQPKATRENRSNRGYLLATVGLSLLFASGIGYHLVTQEFKTLVKLSGRHDELAQCLDRQAQQRLLHTGMAHYWQASYLTLLSQQNLQIVQVNRDLSIYHYNNHLRWYDHEPDFVLIDQNIEPSYRIDQTAILNQFGPPAASFRCGNTKVLVYNRPTDLPFRRHLQTQPVRARFDQPGDSFTFYGSSLPSLIGGLNIGLSKAASEVWGNRSGELGMVPLMQLPADSYHFAIHYYGDGTDTGRWEVATQDEEDRTVLAQGELAESGRQVQQGSFTLSSPSNVVLTVFYEGRGALYLDKIWLQRAGSASPLPPAPIGNGQLTLIYPRPQSFLVQPQADFVWQWTGPPLTDQQAFEVRIWQEAAPYHYGAHDAAASRAELRQIDDTYTLHLDLGGAYSLQQQGRGAYSWSVALVNVEPSYQDLQIEATPSIFFWEPK